MVHTKASDACKHVVIFEPLSGGHRSEFISHLIDFLSVKGVPASQRYTFVVSRDLSILDALPAGVTVELLTEEWEKKLRENQSRFSGFVHFNVLMYYVKKLCPDRIILMNLTEIELSLCFRRLPVSFAGILFVQYPELKWVRHRSLRNRLKFLLKEIKTTLFVGNRRLDSVFLLNGERASGYLNDRFGVNSFRSLPDPVLSAQPEDSFDLRRSYEIKEDQKVFLFFGSMSQRKGVEPLVSSIGKLAEKEQGRSVFVFCGKPEDHYADRYSDLLSALKNENPKVNLRVESGFVSAERMQSMFEQSDWILLPYTRPEYSSGILGHAVACNTPVIGPMDGVIGRQIQDNGFGLVSEIDPGAFAETLGRALEMDFCMDVTSRGRFLKASTPERFASILLGKIR